MFHLSDFNFPFIRVAIVDDHITVAEGFERLINESENARVVGKAYTGAGCMKLLEAAPCDLVLLDMSIPDVHGIDLCRQIKEKYPHLKVIILTGYCELFTINRALAAGANGYLLKSCTTQELLEGISAVSSGIRFLCEEVCEAIKKSEYKQLNFTLREMELLQLIIGGNTIAEQADKMCLGENTIRNYHQKLHVKLEVRNTTQLIQKARELGLAR